MDSLPRNTAVAVTEAMDFSAAKVELTAFPAEKSQTELVGYQSMVIVGVPALADKTFVGYNDLLIQNDMTSEKMVAILKNKTVTKLHEGLAVPEAPIDKTSETAADATKKAEGAAAAAATTVAGSVVDPVVAPAPWENYQIALAIAGVLALVAGAYYLMAGDKEVEEDETTDGDETENHEEA